MGNRRFFPLFYKNHKKDLLFILSWCIIIYVLKNSTCHMDH